MVKPKAKWAQWFTPPRLMRASIHAILTNSYVEMHSRKNSYGGKELLIPR